MFVQNYPIEFPRWVEMLVAASWKQNLTWGYSPLLRWKLLEGLHLFHLRLQPSSTFLLFLSNRFSLAIVVD